MYRHGERTDAGIEGLCSLYGDIEGESSRFYGDVTLKLRAPNDVQTNGAERRLVLKSLFYGTSGMTGMRR